MYSQIQDYLRYAASLGRITGRFGPFLATITESWDNPYVNYAIPDDGAEPASAEVEAMVAFFAAHQRLARLEYIPEIAPRLEGILLAHGFAQENSHPLMVATPRRGGVAVPAGFEVREAWQEADLAGMLGAQHDAYQQPPPREEDVRRMVDLVSRGAFAVCGVESASGMYVGGGVCTTPRGGVTELAGVGVRAGFQRRGLGEAITSELLRLCAERDVRFPFLMAGDAGAARMYARAGFREVGAVLHIRRG